MRWLYRLGWHRKMLCGAGIHRYCAAYRLPWLTCFMHEWMCEHCGKVRHD